MGALPNYLSAIHNAHPNYAGYLDDKKTLTIESMNEVFGMMCPDRKVVYDKKYIEHLYWKYMSINNNSKTDEGELKKRLQGN